MESDLVGPSCLLELAKFAKGVNKAYFSELKHREPRRIGAFEHHHGGSLEEDKGHSQGH